MQEGQSSPRPLFPSIGQAVLLVVAMLVVQIIVGVFIGFFAAMANPGITAREVMDNAWVQTLNGLGTGAAILLGLRSTRERVAAFFAIRRFSVPLLLPIVVTALGLAVLMEELVDGTYELVRAISPAQAAKTWFLDLSANPLGSFVLAVVVAPVAEEYLFRGLILRGLLTRHSPSVAIFVSAMLFGLMHGNIFQIPLGFVLGLVFGWWYLRTGSLGPGLAGHALFNFVAWFTQQIPGGIGPLGGVPPDGVVHLPPWMLLSAILLTATGLVWFKLAADALPTPEIPVPRAAITDSLEPPVLEKPDPVDLPPMLAAEDAPGETRSTIVSTNADSQPDPR